MGPAMYAMDLAAWRAAVECDWRVLDVAPKELCAEHEVMLSAVLQSGQALSHASEELRGVRSVALAAIRGDATALEFVSPQLALDTTFILEAAAQNLRVLEVCDAEHREDRELIRAAIKQNWNALRYAAPFLRRDAGVCLEAVQQHWRALLHCDEAMWSDRDFMYQAIRCRWQSFQFLGPDLREDHQLVLEVVVGGACVPAQALCNFAEQLNQGKVAAAPKETPEDRRLSCKDDRIVLLRALAAEAIGTGLIVLFGCGSVCATLSGAYSGVWQVAAVWGLGVSLAIYCTAEASGAHLNPAVTLAFLLVRPQAHGMTVVKCSGVCLALESGGFSLILESPGFDGVDALEDPRTTSSVASPDRSFQLQHLVSNSENMGYFPNPGLSKEYGSGPYTQDDVSVFGALMTEAWGTLILAFVIFGITNGRNKVLGSAERVGVPFVIGMTVAVLLPLYAPITQAGWNPARDFGPRIVAALGGWGEVAIPGPRSGFWTLGPDFGCTSKRVAALRRDVLMAC
ncbi:glpF [Symbiodinium sp. CCMP2456]|nr:glpF [Symbiodinium sp. CCMP2456]